MTLMLSSLLQRLRALTLGLEPQKETLELEKQMTSLVQVTTTKHLPTRMLDTNLVENIKKNTMKYQAQDLMKLELKERKRLELIKWELLQDKLCYLINQQQICQGQEIIIQIKLKLLEKEALLFQLEENKRI